MCCRERAGVRRTKRGQGQYVLYSQKKSHKYKTTSSIYHQCFKTGPRLSSSLFTVFMKCVEASVVTASCSHQRVGYLYVFKSRIFKPHKMRAGARLASRRRATRGTGTGPPWPSVRAPGPAWAAGRCWRCAPRLWTTRTSPPTRPVNPTASAWWCDAGRLTENNVNNYRIYTVYK